MATPNDTLTIYKDERGPMLTLVLSGWWGQTNLRIHPLTLGLHILELCDAAEEYLRGEEALDREYGPEPGSK